MADEPKDTDAEPNGHGTTVIDSDDASEEPGLSAAGRSRAHDEIDPELISLARPRLPVGPLLALSIVVFCVYMLITLRHDFRFSRQSDAPAATTVGALVAGQTADDAFVSVHAVPDRSFALRVAPHEMPGGHRIAPVLGSNGALWLMVEARPWAGKVQYADDYTGRLRPLADMPFADDLREYLVERGPTPQSVQASELRVALESGAKQVRRPSGDAVAVQATTRVSISETVSGEVLVRAFIREDRLPDHAAWSKALTAAGILPAATTPDSSDDEMLVYRVPAPEGLAGIKKKLITARLFAARAEPFVREHSDTFGQLKTRGQGLSVAGALVPWTSMSAIVIEAPRTLPDSALVLVTDEAPGAYWYVMPLYGLLTIFVALFMWALVRSIRRDREAARSGASGGSGVSGASNPAESAA